MFDAKSKFNWELRADLVEEIARRNALLVKHLESGNEVAAMFTRNGLVDAYWHLYEAHKEFDTDLTAYTNATPIKKTFLQKLLRK